jgi:hypothetical protein
MQHRVRGFRFRQRLHPAVAITLATAFACGDPSGPEPDGNQFDLVRDTEAPIQTDRLEYAMSESAAALTTRIPITWRNTTGRTIYIPNCPVASEPAYLVDLLRWSGGTYESSLEGLERDCSGAPHTIAAGDLFVDTIDIAGARPGGQPPAFRIEPVQGIYRILVRSAFFTYDLEHDALADSLPTLDRVSNRFGLIVPD